MCLWKQMMNKINRIESKEGKLKFRIVLLWGGVGSWRPSLTLAEMNPSFDREKPEDQGVHTILTNKPRPDRSQTTPDSEPVSSSPQPQPQPEDAKATRDTG